MNVLVVVVVTLIAPSAFGSSDPNDRSLHYLGGENKNVDGKQQDKGGAPCVDIKDCDWYGPDVCLDNETFALKNCRQYCGFCGVKCKDSLKDCNEYSDSVCKNSKYDIWATSNCAKRCGKCYKFVPDYIPCYDRDDGCEKFSDHFCRQNRNWGRQHCKKRCGQCGCKDVLKNCHEYGAGVCLANRTWSIKNCADFCDYCHLANTVSSTTTTTTPLPKTTTVPPKTNAPRSRLLSDGGSDCKDKLTNCAAYGDYSCRGDYIPWGKQNCQKTCGFCTSEKIEVCQDKVDNCAAFGSTVCSTHQGWSEVNCRKFCNICTSKVTTTTSTTTVETTTPVAVISGCNDAIDNCAAYGKTSCSGTYEPWARKNCPLFCGFCIQGNLKTTSAVTCTDAIGNCNAYGSSACSGAYEPWAKINCQKFCGFCTALTTTAPPISGNCKDNLSSCSKYGDLICTVEEKWIRENCAKHCNLC